MDLKGFVDCFDAMTCVLSVEKKPDGGYSTIRIVTGNGKYIDSLALTEADARMYADKEACYRENPDLRRR